MRPRADHPVEADPAPAPELAALGLPPLLAGRYLLQRILGAGAQGWVVQAQDRELGRPVAIKLLGVARGSNDGRWEREAQAASRIDHPHVVKLFDSSIEGDLRFLVYELVRGTGLDRVAGSLAGFAVRDRIRWMAEIASGLAALHGSGIVHRDVKPANISIREDGAAVLLDLGLALLEDRATVLTRPGALVGSLGYMAPEAFRAEPLGPGSDQFSLGAVLYELLYERSYRPGRDLGHFLALARSGAAPPLGRFPEVDPAIARALMADPAGRFPGIGEFEAALRPFALSPPTRTMEPARAPVAAEVRSGGTPAPAAPAPPAPVRGGSAAPGPWFVLGLAIGLATGLALGRPGPGAPESAPEAPPLPSPAGLVPPSLAELETIADRWLHRDGKGKVRDAGLRAGRDPHLLDHTERLLAAETLVRWKADLATVGRWIEHALGPDGEALDRDLRDRWLARIFRDFLAHSLHDWLALRKLASRGLPGVDAGAAARIGEHAALEAAALVARIRARPEAERSPYPEYLLLVRSGLPSVGSGELLAEVDSRLDQMVVPEDRHRILFMARLLLVRRQVNEDSTCNGLCPALRRGLARLTSWPGGTAEAPSWHLIESVLVQAGRWLGRCPLESCDQVAQELTVVLQHVRLLAATSGSSTAHAPAQEALELVEEGLKTRLGGLEPEAETLVDLLRAIRDSSRPPDPLPPTR